MSRTQLIILWAVTLVCAFAVFKLNDKGDKKVTDQTTLQPGTEVFTQEQFRQVGGLRLKDQDHTATLNVKEEKWTVAEEENFPADLTKLQRFFDQLDELKITRGIPATSEYLNRFGLDENSEKVSERPREVTILKQDGGDLKKILIGKRSETSGGLQQAAGQAGRFIKFADDDSGIYVVPDSFSILDTDPTAWIRRDFISIQRPLEISVTPADQQVKSWTVSRDSASENFDLQGLASDMQTADAVAAPLKNVFASASFNELLSEAEAKEQRSEAEARKVVIKTDSKASYELTLWPIKKSETENSENETPTPGTPDRSSAEDTRDIILTLKAVKGPEPPAPIADDASEEKKTAFQAATINYKDAPDRFAVNQSLEGRFFLVSRSIVAPLLLTREELDQQKPKPAPASTPAAPAQPAPPVTPPKATAFTPPVAVSGTDVPSAPKPALEGEPKAEPKPKFEGSPTAPAGPANPVQPAPTPAPAPVPAPVEPKPQPAPTEPETEPVPTPQPAPAEPKKDTPASPQPAPAEPAPTPTPTPAPADPSPEEESPALIPEDPFTNE